MNDFRFLSIHPKTFEIYFSDHLKETVRAKISKYALEKYLVLEILDLFLKDFFNF